MAVFFSFHYDRDSWRVQQVMNIQAIEGQPLLTSQEWEAVKKRGDKAIEDWINEQMSYKTAVVVLAGKETANRKWVNYEIIRAWNNKKPLVGIRIHGLADQNGRTDTAGSNPFSAISLRNGGTLANYVPLHDPAGWDSKGVYANIKANIEAWVASAYRRS